MDDEEAPMAGASPGAGSVLSGGGATAVPVPTWRARTPVDAADLDAALREVRGCARLPEVPYPHAPAFGRASLVATPAQIWAFQQYITSLECVCATTTTNTKCL
jgi:hypothetical protein